MSKRGTRFHAPSGCEKKDFKTLVGYWDSRTPVTVTDEAGDVWENLRVIVKSYEYVPHFPSKAVQASLEFWRI